MRVLKIELEGITTSFRYPHFLVGRQPAYRMPPPATIYGHICSAVGEWIEASFLRFGYCFTYMARGDDLEHIHMATVAGEHFDKKLGFVKNIEAEINPIPREILFYPRLTLYIQAQSSLERLYQAFCSPCYPVILGRSQDLASYRDVSIVELQSDCRGYFEKTILPWHFRDRTSAGTSVLMPRFINPRNRREVIWERYVVLEHRVFYGVSEETEKGVKTMLRYENDEPVLIDPETPENHGMRRAIPWHSFIGQNEKNGIKMAKT
jgi:CRISPR-associated protein Cas5t